MLRKILVPTDFSSGYERAVFSFEKLNEVPVGEVVLLHVVNEEEIELIEDVLEFKSGSGGVQAMELGLVDLAEKRIETEKEKIKSAFRTENVKTIVRVGIPWEEIVRVAEEEDVSIIFLPSHGKLGFSSELFGSTTLRVLEKTVRPVLLIKTKR